MKAASLILAALAGTLVGCSGGDYRVTREDPETVRDLTYRFTEDDAREVYQNTIANALAMPWLDNWMREHGGQRPIVVVGNMKNATEDYINTDIFTSPFERDLINSGRVRVKAQKDIRAELRDERLDTEFNDPETLKAIAKELNADLILVGQINDDKQRSVSGNKVIAYYQANLELINVETAEKVWIGSHEIQKVARR